MFWSLAASVHKLKWPVTLGLLLFTMVMGHKALGLGIDPSMETLFDKKSPEYLYFRQYSEKFGSDQMIAVAMATPGIFEIRTLKKLGEITRELSSFEPVERVLSLANAKDIRSKIIGIKTEPVLKGVFKGERSLADLKAEVLANELFTGNLVSKDGRIASLLVYLKPAGKDLHQSGYFIKRLRAYLSEQERPDLRFYIAGLPVEQYDFIRLIRRDQFTFVPLITLLLILTTFVIYRSLACMILCMTIVFVTLVWTMGTIAWMGQPLNLMTSLLAPVIMIVSVINAIYLMNAFFEIRIREPSLERAVSMTISELGVPCFLTHFTAVLGFASLALNPVPAMQSFGFFAALGTFYSYLVELITTPILFSLLPYRTIGHDPDPEHAFHKALAFFLERLDLRGKWWILLMTAGLIGLSAAGIRRLEVDTNIVKQMKPDLPLAVSTRFIDENLTGVYALGFVLRPKAGKELWEPGLLRKIDRFKSFLESKPEISKVNAVTTVIKKINQAKEDQEKGSYKIPQDPELLRRYLEGIAGSKDPEAAKIISADLRETCLDARMRAVGTTQGAQLELAARRYLQLNLAGDFDYELTGSAVLLGHMAKGLVHEQMNSFGFAFVSILIVIAVSLRSLKLGLLAAIPNLIPILGVYGIMGFVPIELSTPTAMISSIVLGLVVDASIQFLYRFRSEFEIRGHYLQALHHTYLNMGHSMVVSTLILTIGFASSFFASFRPTVHFGLLTSLTIVLALLCTLIVLPVCLLIFKPFGPNRLLRAAETEV